MGEIYKLFCNPEDVKRIRNRGIAHVMFNSKAKFEVVKDGQVIQEYDNQTMAQHRAQYENGN